MSMVPASPEEVRDLVASLPTWSVDLDDDPEWVRNTVDFGFAKPMVDEEDERRMDSLVKVLADLNCELNPKPVDMIDSAKILYSSQPFVRLDALLHYMQTSELFDPDGWYGNNHPVLAPWKDGYLVLDGTHRALAARLMGVPCPAIVLEY